MKKFLIISIFIYAVFGQKKAEVKYGWANTMTANLNYTQSGYTNWAKGGENSLSWQSNLQYQFVKNEKEYNWNTNGKFSFGETKVGSKSDFRKTSDEIKFESVYTYKLGTHINPYGAITASTQFTTSYDYNVEPAVKISTFMDPGYFTQSFGVGYAQEEVFKIRTGLSFKETVTSKYRTRYTDDPKTTEKEDFKFETGLEIAGSYNTNISEKIVYKSKLEIFSALDAIKNVDVYFDNVFSSKISEILTVSFTYTILYDVDLSKSIQTKQVLAVGIGYALL